MTERKWTPGPWIACNGTDVYPVEDWQARKHIADCDPENAPTSNSVEGQHPTTDLTYEEAVANAHIIATAPEMHSALEEARDALDQYSSDPCVDPIIAKINIILAKAEGRDR